MMTLLKSLGSVVGLSCIVALPLPGQAATWSTGISGDYTAQDDTNSTVPFVIKPNAPNNSIFIDPNGNVGLGTAIPGGAFSARLYIADPTPEIVFDTGTQIWDFLGNDDGFGVVDETAGTFPFHIEASAPSASFFIKDSGNLGLGTIAPIVSLHVVGDSVDPVEELFRLESTTSPQQVFLNSTTGAKWFFAQTSNGDFKVSFDGTGKVEARFKPDGTLKIAGALIENSDRDSKKNIEEIDSIEVLERVVRLPISTWEYKANSGVKHLGPMAQDFYETFGLGQSPTGISTIDTGGVALAAIKGLKQEKDNQIEQLKAKSEALAVSNAALQAQLRDQDERMIQLEMALAEVLRNQSTGVKISSTK